MLTSEIIANKGLISTEDLNNVESVEFLRSIKNSHSSLAKNCKNILEIGTEDVFPE